MLRNPELLPITLPPPWRRFFQAHPEIATNSSSYAGVLKAFAGQDQQLIPNSVVDQWSADTLKGQLQIQLIEGGQLLAECQLVGIHDGLVFRWAQKNAHKPSDAAATAARAVVGRLVPELDGLQALQTNERDLRALMAMCGEALAVERVFCAHGGASELFVFFLQGLRLQQVDNKAPPRGLLARLKRGLRNERRVSPFVDLDELFSQQVAAVQVGQGVLAEVEQIIQETAPLYAAGAYEEAIQRVQEAKGLLGNFYIDQEPTGWLLTCEGACLLQQGQMTAATDTFRDALRALVVPDALVIGLGLARSAPNEQSRRSELAAIYLSAPDRLTQLATAEEAAAMGSHIERMEHARASDLSAEATLYAALAERLKQEQEAWRRSEEASHHRTESHILSETDLAATVANNAAYRDVLLTWFDVPVAPNMGSMSARPNEDPDCLESLSQVQVGNETLDFTAVFSEESGYKRTYRYRLVRRAIPLSHRLFWRIAGVWSVWPDEDIRLI